MYKNYTENIFQKQKRAYLEKKEMKKGRSLAIYLYTIKKERLSSI